MTTPLIFMDIDHEDFALSVDGKTTELVLSPYEGLLSVPSLTLSASGFYQQVTLEEFIRRAKRYRDLRTFLLEVFDAFARG